jgi:hypothetical protein
VVKKISIVGVCKLFTTSTIVHNTLPPTLSLPTLGSSTRGAFHHLALFGIICKKPIPKK